MVADQSAPKIPKMPENLSTQIILNLKFQFKKRASFIGLGVRGPWLCHIFLDPMVLLF